MEMPPGWESLKKYVDSIKVEANDPRNYDHAHIAQIAVHEMWNTPLDLMKEMAEALQDAHDYILSENGERRSEMQRKVLKKFKKWR